MTDFVHKVIGIDPSLTTTAVCVSSADDGWFEMNTFKSSPVGYHVADRIKRYLDFSREIVDQCEEHSVTLVLIEGFVFTSAQASVQGEFGGILRCKLLAAFPGLVHEVAPATLKKFVTGKGNASKVAMAGAIAHRDGVEFDTDEAYDAFGIAQMARQLVGWSKPANQWQRDSLESLRAGMEFKTSPTEAPVPPGLVV